MRPASRSSGSGITSTRSWRCSRPVARRADTTHARRGAGRRGRVGAFPVFWLARRRLGSDGAAMLALGVPRVSVDRVDGRRRVPSRDAGDSAFPLLHLVPRHRPARPVRRLRRARRTTGELMALGIAALGLWYAFAEGRRRAGVRSRPSASAWTCVALLRRRARLLGRRRASTTAHTTHVGGSPPGSSERRSRARRRSSPR